MRRGFTLVEIMVTVAILGITVVATAWALNARATQQHDDAAVLTSLIARARSIATTNGEGATLGVTSSANGGSVVTVYSDRPYPSSNVTAIESETLDASTITFDGVSQPVAIFFDPSGAVSSSAWSNGQTFSSEPTCTTNVSISLAPVHGTAAAGAAMTLACTNGVVQ